MSNVEYVLVFIDSSSECVNFVSKRSIDCFLLKRWLDLVSSERRLI